MKGGINGLLTLMTVLNFTTTLLCHFLNNAIIHTPSARSIKKNRDKKSKNSGPELKKRNNLSGHPLLSSSYESNPGTNNMEEK
ncbi:uncharacterized protein BX663DRAFT_492925 [Cokeromyces recurvatus]|uniref:uncharacterized protein n=1 Tax=Cokeromyces recurvatus TaxID=90255 RepID=UPI0022210905|nr:uncharacterized protein BX663DRAFT_492925 [Cokeromyces recurvatus]KAI7908084.1 hypothetical protein BX663DRAFT_492925 [Cokeromyces recurvatus]